MFKAAMFKNFSNFFCNHQVRLGVSAETIRTDVLALMCIYPIEVVRGCNGGVKLAEGYPSRRKTLNEKQSVLLVQLRTQLTGEDLQTLDNIILQFAAY